MILFSVFDTIFLSILQVFDIYVKMIFWTPKWVSLFRSQELNSIFFRIKLLLKALKFITMTEEINIAVLANKVYDPCGKFLLIPV